MVIEKKIYTESLWLKFLPNYFKKKIANRPNLQKIVSNINWLFFDQVLRMGVGLFVGVWVARYLGPSDYGLLNFAMAFTALFGVFAVLGLNRIVVREIVKHPKLTNELLGSSFGLKSIGGAIAFILSVFAIVLLRPNEPLTIALVALIAGGFIFQSITVIGLYFQSQVQSKYTVYATTSSFIIISIIKVILILSKAPLIAFATIGLIEIILSSLFLIIVYTYNHHSIKNWVFRKNRAKELLKDSWPLLLSGMAIMIYRRIDQVMLGQMIGEYSVGIYSAAVRISEVWYFVPVIVSTSLYPRFIELYDLDKKVYLRKLIKVMSLFFWIFLIMACMVFFFSRYIVSLLYGAKYIESAAVLSIHIFSGILVSTGVILGHRYILRNQQRFLLYATMVGAIVNILSNLILIPSYGAKGAAIATLISSAISPIFVAVFLDRSVGVIYFKSVFNLRLWR
jgi:O-antigen/teichoic acid export membrane protein